MKFDHEGGRLSGCNQRFSLSVKRHTFPPHLYQGSAVGAYIYGWQLCSNPNLPSMCECISPSEFYEEGDIHEHFKSIFKLQFNST